MHYNHCNQNICNYVFLPFFNMYTLNYYFNYKQHVQCLRIFYFLKLNKINSQHINVMIVLIYLPVIGLTEYPRFLRPRVNGRSIENRPSVVKAPFW